jgi:hypothetical protein
MVLLAKLDADVNVSDEDYVALCTPQPRISAD